MKKLRYIIPLILALGFPAFALATTQTFTANGIFTDPAGVTTVQVNGYAGGGGTGTTTSNPVGISGGGGGGGAYSGLNAFSVTPGNTYTVIVGQGGTGGDINVNVPGGDSMFSASSTLLAKGGLSALISTGATGGSAASGVGDVKHSGGTGGSGSGVGTTQCGGGGGGGAGTTADGGTGAAGTTCSPTSAGGTGGSVGGGVGGIGSAPSTIGNVGNTFGGGGGGPGGGTPGFTSAKGARGEVDITYTAASVSTQSHSQTLISGGTTTFTSGTTIFQ